MIDEKIFGTDGIRRKVSDFSIEFLLHLGQAVGNWLKQNNQAASVLIGRDTRNSGELIESALSAGLLSQGVTVSSLGIIPTPGVAYLTKNTAANLGIMLSGSHNSAADNGIKFFNDAGLKISETVEQEIETILRQQASYPTANFDKLGRLQAGQAYFNEYVDHLVASWRGKQDLSAYKIVMDATNGATYQIAPDVLNRLGANLIVINNSPDGLNINPDYDSDNYDSHKPARVRDLVIREKADLGISFDGDGDRLLLVDEQGNFLDGDHILAMLAKEMKDAGTLKKDEVVTTIMRNLGLDMALQEMGLSLAVTAVGDKYVTETMLQNDTVLGGEQAGHIIIFEDGQTTGDGLYAALRIAALMVNSGQALSHLAGMVHQYPQKIQNIKNVPLVPVIQIPGLVEQIEKSEAILAASGPCFTNVRYSGTEKGLVRVTVKGIVAEAVEQETANITQVIVRWRDKQ